MSRVTLASEVLYYLTNRSFPKVGNEYGAVSSGGDLAVFLGSDLWRDRGIVAYCISALQVVVHSRPSDSY